MFSSHIQIQIQIFHLIINYLLKIVINVGKFYTFQEDGLLYF